MRKNKKQLLIDSCFILGGQIMLNVNIKIGLTIMVLTMLLCSLFVLFYSKSHPQNQWSILISEEGALIDSNSELPFKYTYINEKDKVYIFSQSQDIKEVVQEQPPMN